MSKSKGNIIDPVKMLNEYGTDAVRYWTGTSRLGNDTVLAPNTLKQGKRLVNKLWNACKLAKSSFGESVPQAESAKADVEAGILLHPLDQWVLAELEQTIQKATDSFEAYEYANAFRTIEEFFWSVFCDNYLELIKYRVRDIEGAVSPEQRSAQHTLLHACRAILRLLGPLMPYVTETIAPEFALPQDDPNGIHARGSWPKAEDFAGQEARLDLGATVVDVVAGMRKVKSSLGVSMRAEVATLHVWAVDGGSNDDLSKLLTPVMRDLLETSTALELVFAAPAGDAPQTETPSGNLNVALTMSEAEE